jgi:hypothetical protein
MRIVLCEDQERADEETESRILSCFDKTVPDAYIGGWKEGREVFLILDVSPERAARFPRKERKS